MNICLNFECEKEYVRIKKNQRYCSKSCQIKQHNLTSTERREITRRNKQNIEFNNYIESLNIKTKISLHEDIKNKNTMEITEPLYLDTGKLTREFVEGSK
jgi:hypothetical protein